MSARGTRVLLPHDQALSHLAVAFDGERMRAMLQELVDPSGKSGIRVVDCSIARSKYRLGRNCMVLYRASISDGSGGLPHEQLFSCGIYSAEEAAARYRKEVQASLVAPRFGPPITHIPAHNMVIWAYPNERNLKALPQLADYAKLEREVLPEVVEARWGRRRAIESVTTSIAGYFPEHACCLRVSIRFADQHEAEDWVVYGKTSFDDRGADTFRAMQALQESEAHRLGRLGMARPLIYQPAHRLLWQEGVPGATVESLLLDGISAPRLLWRLGAAVAELHRIRLPGLRELPAAEILSTLHGRTRMLAQAIPQLAGRLRKLSRTLTESAAVVMALGDASLHGDLHLNNVLADGQDLYLVDFDSLGQGPAAIELGSFIAALQYRAAMRRMSDLDARVSAECFLRAYESVSRSHLRRREIAWHAAAALIYERMSRCLTALKPGRFELMNDLLDRAELLCAGALGRSRSGESAREERTLQ